MIITPYERPARYMLFYRPICIACLGNEKVFNNCYNLSCGEFVSYKKLINVLEEISGKELKTEKLSVDEINRKKIPLPFPIEQHELYSGSKIANTWTLPIPLF